MTLALLGLLPDNACAWISNFFQKRIDAASPEAIMGAVNSGSASPVVNPHGYPGVARTMCRSFSVAVCAGAVMLLTLDVQAQNLFVSDFGSGNIYEFTQSGVRTTFASGLNLPNGLAFNGAGMLFEADDGSGNVYEFTPGGARSVFASGLTTPHDLAFDSAGNLFVACGYGTSGYIAEITPSGTETTFASGSLIFGPMGIAFNSAGNLYVANLYPGYITDITPSGDKSVVAGGLSLPYGLAFDNAGNLYVANDGSRNVIKIATSGAQSIYGGGLLNYPYGLAFNGMGDLFVSDFGYGLIAEIQPSGSTTFFAMGLDEPTGLAIESIPEPSVLRALAGYGIALTACLRRDWLVREAVVKRSFTSLT
jgi:DNA-binding beta-propeller fold protein YncE